MISSYLYNAHQISDYHDAPYQIREPFSRFARINFIVTTVVKNIFE